MTSADYHHPPACLPNMNIVNFLGDPEERNWSGPFTFIQGADTQFGMIQHYLLNKTEPNWDIELALTRDLIQRINLMSPKPKFFVICGDMLDAFPYSKKPTNAFPPEKQESYPWGIKDRREEQYQSFVQIFKELDPEVKLVCVCGNHDIGDIPDRDTLKVYRAQFGQDYFAFWVGGVKFVVLNSQYTQEPDAIPEETEKQNRFIDENIKDSSAKHIVVFQHISLFINEPHEPDEYFNTKYNRRIEILDKLRDAGVKYVFCGHYHRNAGGMYKDLEQVITSAIGAPLGKDPSGYRIVNVEEERITHEYKTLKDSTTF